MEPEDNVEVGSTFHNHLIRTDSKQNTLVEEDGGTSIRNYHDYVCNKRKRAAIIGTVVIVLVVLVSFAIVYFTHIRPKNKRNQLSECDGSETKFKAVEGKCFQHIDGQTAGTSFKGHVGECMALCMSSRTCLSIDYNVGDGKCRVFTVTSNTMLLDSTGSQKMGRQNAEQRRQLATCMHYDRLCI